MEEASSGSQASPGEEGSADQDAAAAADGVAGFFQNAAPQEHDMFLPIANISRIMRQVLPANAKIAKEARESVQECVTEFISFITSEASDKCLLEKRKTINGDDIICAMTTLGFENYVELLKVYLQRYKELEGDIKVTGGSQSGLEPPLKKEEGSSANLPNVEE